MTEDHVRNQFRSISIGLDYVIENFIAKTHQDEFKIEYLRKEDKKRNQLMQANQAVKIKNATHPNIQKRD